MITRSLLIDSCLQLTASTLMKIVDFCNSLNCKITLKRNSTEADGRSLLELLFLNTEKSETIKIITDGVDELFALNSICKMFNNVSECAGMAA